MTASRLLFGLSGFGERVRKVPSQAVQEEEGDELLIECPCGAHPVVGPVIGPCPGEECERWYVAASGFAFVVYGNMEPPTS